MKRPSGLLVAALATAATSGATLTRPARAGGDEVATAQVLFDEGRRRMAQGDYEGACPRLAESQRLAPALGTEFNLADCWEHVGKLASSWAAFLDVADQTHRRGERERERAARERIEALEPRLGKLVLEVPAGRRAKDLELRRDREPVGEALWGIAVPVDAGEHRLEARAPERSPWSATVTTKDGQTTSVTMPELTPAPAPGDAAAAPPASAVTSATPPAPAPPSPVGSPVAPPPPPPLPGPDHTAAFLSLGAAAVFAGVGAVGLGERQSKVGDYNSDPTCPGIADSARPAHCNDLVSSANTWATVSVVSFVASGVALAVGVTLWATASAAKPSSTAAAAGCFAGPGALTCAGRF